MIYVYKFYENQDRWCNGDEERTCNDDDVLISDDEEDDSVTSTTRDWEDVNMKVSVASDEI